MSVLHSPAFKYSDSDLKKNPAMESSIGYPQQHCHQQSYGLLRYCSAPSTMLASLVDNEAFRSEDHRQRYLPPSTSEMETMLSKLISSNNEWSNSEALQEFESKTVKQEEAGNSVSQQNGCYSSYGSQLIYQSQQIQGLPKGFCSSSASGNGFDGSFSVMNSMASENSTQSKMGATRNCSNLIRQKSSPAGFFPNSSTEYGLAALKEVGKFKACDVSNGQATATTTTCGLHGTLAFSSRPSSYSRTMPQIAENGNEIIEANCDQGRNMPKDNISDKCYMPATFTSDFWEGSAFSVQKTASDDEIMFSTSNAFESQDADFAYQNIGLSLPSSSRKMASIEKFLQIQGSVPCKIRAKRGFATHPRSIAERVRRTRISERIKKLQDLFPKSEKQTSTADMLELAVEYIKDLQEQVKKLADSKAKCKCTSNQKQ